MRETDRKSAGHYPNGVIQTGGKATRLGPLAAMMSKALVSIGNRPQVVNQILQLQEAGCRQILVVASESTLKQTQDLVFRAGLHTLAKVIADPHQQGPVMGMVVALNDPIIDINARTYVLFADTVLSEPIPKYGNWIGVSRSYDPCRSWCYAVDAWSYADGIPDLMAPVTIGAYCFTDTQRALDSAVNAMMTGPPPVAMSAFLNNYPHTLKHEVFDTWSDVGDLFALAAARRSRFISRSHHSLNLHDDGTITKKGVSSEEMQFMRMVGELRVGGQTLFPTVYDTGRNSYTMEFVDLPTLAELWLYWPGSGDTWAMIVRSIIDRIGRDLWSNAESDPMTQEEVHNYFGRKAWNRLIQWKPDGEFLSDETLFSQIGKASEIIGEDKWVHGHGDLNFTNILYSLNTGAFKLLDPRGGWIPEIYEYAKLAYSPIYSAVVHDLFNEDGEIYPARLEENQAVIEELTKDVDAQRLTACIALTLLAACPLHPKKQAEMFYTIGRKMLDAVTGKEA